MASFSRAATIADEGEQFDRSNTIRLAGWGFAAIIAATTAILAGRTDIGLKRTQAALAAMMASPSDPPPAMIRQLLARTADTEREARRLNETVRTLTSERDRLAMRLGMVEREMGDLTGSINRAASAANHGQMPAADSTMALPGSGSTPAFAASVLAFPPPSTIPSRPPQPAPGAGSTTQQPATQSITVSPAAPNAGPWPGPEVTANAPTFVPLPMPRPSEQISMATQSVPTNPPDIAPDQADATPMAAPPPARVAKAEVAEPQPKAAIGVDLGPALTMARLRARWAAFRATYGSLADGLRPLISVREVGQGKPLEMRLVVGPVADADAAARLCATLAGSQFVCHPSVFDGQRLALR